MDSLRFPVFCNGLMHSCVIFEDLSILTMDHGDSDKAMIEMGMNVPPCMEIARHWDTFVSVCHMVHAIGNRLNFLLSTLISGPKGFELVSPEIVCKFIVSILYDIIESDKENYGTELFKMIKIMQGPLSKEEVIRLTEYNKAKYPETNCFSEQNMITDFYSGIRSIFVDGNEDLFRVHMKNVLMWAIIIMERNIMSHDTKLTHREAENMACSHAIGVMQDVIDSTYDFLQ